MEILNHHQIQQRIRRIAIQILENNYDEKRITLVGLNDNGYAFAELLVEELRKVSEVELQLARVRLNPAQPLSSKVEMDTPIEKLQDGVVILVDDVANTGRTTFFAMRPFLGIIPKKMEVAVLVDREHKTFPIFCNYVGLSLATTLNENIEVRILGHEQAMSAHLH